MSVLREEALSYICGYEVLDESVKINKLTDYEGSKVHWTVKGRTKTGQMFALVFNRCIDKLIDEYFTKMAERLNKDIKNGVDVPDIFKEKAPLSAADLAAIYQKKKIVIYFGHYLSASNAAADAASIATNVGRSIKRTVKDIKDGSGDEVNETENSNKKSKKTTCYMRVLKGKFVDQYEVDFDIDNEMKMTDFRVKWPVTR